MMQGMPPRPDLPRCDILATKMSVRLDVCQYLICYRYRCELGVVSVRIMENYFLGEAGVDRNLTSGLEENSTESHG
jgi:hypothetical protein